LQVQPQLQASVATCKAVFGEGGLALYSNSAGLAQYDPQGKQSHHFTYVCNAALNCNSAGQYYLPSLIVKYY
jgi:hypothetical protein